MTRPIEPTRWKDDPNAPPGAADALRAYGAPRADAEQRQRLSERLAPLIAHGEPAAASAPRIGNALGARKLLVVSLVVTAILAALLPVVQRHAAPPPPRPPARSVQAPPPSAAQMAVSLPLQSVETPPPSVPQPTSRAHSHVAARPQPAVTASDASPERELELLSKAQAALTRAPSETEAYLHEHVRDYPRGAFVPEREMLFIELALTRGEQGRAQKLARSFVTRFPGSPYQTQLAALLTNADATINQESAPASHTQSMDPTSGGHHATGSAH
jgi:hypothetical protein